MLSLYGEETHQGNKLTRNPRGNVRLQPSQLADPLSAVPGLKKGTGARELVPLKKKKKIKRGRTVCGD